jgi:hypothetical protein
MRRGRGNRTKTATLAQRRKQYTADDVDEVVHHWVLAEDVELCGEVSGRDGHAHGVGDAW